MSTYELLKNLHVLLALVSGLGFALRGFVRLILRRPLMHPLVRFGPHLIDTLLLASGIALWILMSYSPITSGWFGVKLILIVVYIVLGISAFRQKSSAGAVLTYLAALAVFVLIAALALFKPL